MPRADVGAAGLPAAAAGLLLLALLFAHGTSDSRLFWIGLGALLVAAVAVAWQPRPVNGTALAFLASLGALVLWQAATISWSIEPSGSWDYANRGLVYFAFACIGVLLGSAPRSWVAAGLGALTTAVLLVALLAKVVPALYADYGRLARLRWPLEYWNELALLAAMTVPLGLWLASRRERPLRARVAGALHVYVALVAVVLTFSRFGIALAVAAAVAWVWLDRVRLDSFAALVAVVPPAAIVAAVALALPGIANDGTSHATRVRDGAIFAVLLVAGGVAAGMAARVALSSEGDVPRRRRAALGVGVGLAALCVVGVIVLVARAGGPVEFVRVRWHEFSSTQSINTVARIGSASSGNRWAWWQQSWDAFTRHPGGGTGAGSFALTSTIAAHNSLQTTIEPHNTPLQFLTETGIVGFLLYVAVIGSVVVGVVKGPRDRATYALVFVAVIGVVHAIVDIDWSFLATQAPLFVVAGVLVSRPAAAARRSALALAGVGVAILAAAYSLFAPWYANRRLDAGLDAAGRRDLAGAQSAWSDAHTLNPLAIEPIQYLAAVDADPRGAESLYLLATRREPLNPLTWEDLGNFYAGQHRWREAYAALNRSYALNRYASPQLLGLLDLSRCQVDPVTCSTSQLAQVQILPSRLGTLARLARRVAAASGERRPRGVVFVTTRGRFPLTARDTTRPATRVIYAIVLQGRFVARRVSRPRGASAPRGRFLELAVEPRTFEVTDWGIQQRQPNVGRLGRATLLPLG